MAGESVIVVRTKAGELCGFYNVCRHRGSRLCDEASGRMKGAVKCPYHAWAYSFEGQLIGTPNVGKDEVDRDALGLACARLLPGGHTRWRTRHCQAIVKLYPQAIS